jgi:small-conductance mechanosensitive channel
MLPSVIGGLQLVGNPFPLLAGTVSQVLTFVVVVSVIYIVGRFVFEPLLTALLETSGVEITLRRTIEQVVHIGVVLFGLYAALTLSGFSQSINITGPFLAAVTLAVGFAARDVVNNLVSGVFIIADPRFKIGDWIEWNDNTGVIDDITFRTTRVRTFDNEIVSVPNSELATSAVTTPSRRSGFEFPPSSGSVTKTTSTWRRRFSVKKQKRSMKYLIDRSRPFGLWKSTIHVYNSSLGSGFEILVDRTSFGSGLRISPA